MPRFKLRVPTQLDRSQDEEALGPTKTRTARRGVAAGWVLALTLLVSAGTVVVAPPAAAAAVPVTVTITRFIEIGDPDPAPLQGHGDYFARVKIDNHPAEVSERRISREDFDPMDLPSPWVFTREVVTPSEPITITIEVIDDDIGPNDLIDLNPVDAETMLTIILDLDTGEWSGDVPPGQTYSEGDGDTEHSGLFKGGDRAKIFFDISTLSATGDLDGDGLLDGWEQRGLDADGDGAIDVDLSAMGADPRHKDLFVELDWGLGAEPTRFAIQAVKEAFAAAPVDAGGTVNPDNSTGIHLWVDTGAFTNSFGDLVGDNFGGGGYLVDQDGAPWSRDICKLNNRFYQAKRENFDPNRRWVFRYAVSVPGCVDSPAGQAEVGGNDMYLTSRGSGVLMHEFGHNLNLLHGGDESRNCKPNYVSVMNYIYIAIRQVGNNGSIQNIVDYSPPRLAPGVRGNAPLPPLHENDLDEPEVLDPSDQATQIVFVDQHGGSVRSKIGSPVDWNGDGDANDLNVRVNVDNFGNIKSCRNGSSGTTLTGHHDWDVISLPFRQFGDSADTPLNPAIEEPTLDELLRLEEELHTTDLAIDKADSDDPALAGNELTYTLTVANHGPNPADAVRLVDELPSGVRVVSHPDRCVGAEEQVLTCDLGRVPAHDTIDVQITVLIDADLVYRNGGPVALANRATVTDMSDFALDPDTTNNTAVEQTQVKAKCDRTVTGKHTGPVTVTDGVTCIDAATIRGPVTVAAGAGLVATDATVLGAVQTERAEVVQITGVWITGSMSVTGTTEWITIAENQVVGPVFVLENHTGDHPIVVSGNRITGLLSCIGNTPSSIDKGVPNEVSGPTFGQCAG